MKTESLIGLEQLCTGCFSCMNVCPNDAIRIEYKEDGFAYPKVDTSICIGCGLCVKVCTLQETKKEHAVLNIYSAVANSSDVRKSGSSGGIFPLLAEKFLKEDGVVYGVAFSRERLAYHTSTDEVGVSELFRSKYIQSNVGFVYQQIEKNLLLKKSVLFCGTPCQVRGLKNYLKTKHIKDDELFTIDFMCHGVPSPGCFQDILERIECENGKKICNVSFREKDFGWRKQVINFYFEDGEKQQFFSSDFHYYYFFLNNYNIRNSCFECEEYMHHISDVTVADYWNVDKKTDDDEGISLILIHTNKGQEKFNSILKKCVIKELTVEEYNEKQYSHERYNAKNKQRWRNAYNGKGEKYLSTTFFKKEKFRNSINITAKRYLGRAKKFLKLILKK